MILTLTPSGHLVMVGSGNRIAQAFAESQSAGILALAGGKSDPGWPLSWMFRKKPGRSAIPHAPALLLEKAVFVAWRAATRRGAVEQAAPGKADEGRQGVTRTCCRHRPRRMRNNRPA